MATYGGFNVNPPRSWYQKMSNVPARTGETFNDSQEPPGFKFDGRRAGPRRINAILKEAAAISFARRMEILERIADGKIVYRKRRATSDGRKEVEEFEVTPKDRIYALELIGKAAGVFDKEGPEEQMDTDPNAIARALGMALRDPSVRDWLARDPQVIALLREASTREREPVSGEPPGV